MSTAAAAPLPATATPITRTVPWSSRSWPRRGASRPADARPRVSVAAVGGEVGGALLVERGDPFLGLFGVAEQLEAGVGHLPDAGEVLGVGVHRLLQHLQRGGGQAQDLVRPGAHLRLELVGRDDLVDQPPRLGLFRAVLPAQEPDLAGPLLADRPGQVSGAKPGVVGADPGPVLAEPG